MKPFLLICFVLSGSLVVDAYFQTFNNLILNQCLGDNRPIGQRNGQSNNPKSRSMETFISFVERLEEKHGEWDIFLTARTLLQRFGFNGMKVGTVNGVLKAVQDAGYSNRRAIIDRLVALNKDDALNFNENDLNAQEKCDMYFMMGHLINTTYLGDGDEPLLKSANPGDPMLTVSKHPREQGVVSLHSNDIHAVALGKVLLGVVGASIEVNTDPKLTDLYADWKEFLKEHASKQINALAGVTVADVVAEAAMQKADGGRHFGTGGTWNTTECSINYILHEASPGCTLATLRGAIDGFLIGKTLHDLKRSGVNVAEFKLSEVLRMYYDPRGIVTDIGGNKFISYCNRNDVNSAEGLNKLTDSAEGFYHLNNALKYNQGQPADDAKNLVTAVFDEFRQIKDLMFPNDGFCDKNASPDKTKIRCETKSDVFVILDDSERGTSGFQYQTKVISKLASRLDIGLGSGSIGVYYGAKDKSSRALQSVVHNASNRADAACEASRAHFGDIPESDDEETLMLALNTTLQNFELATLEHPHAKAKVVVLFKYGDLKMKDETRVQRAAHIIRQRHRDVRVIAVGDNEKVLFSLATDSKDTIRHQESPDELTKELAEHVCNVPSILQYENCHTTPSMNDDETHMYEDFVTPDSTQYLAMYPEYFLKSYDVYFEFSKPSDRQTGDLEVCFSRIDQNPFQGSPKQGVECQTTKATESKLVFHMNNPCHRYNEDNCPPAYFSVTGRDTATGSARSRCYEPGCRRTDQIKFAVTYKGVSCNSGLMLLASPYLFLVTVVLSYFKK